MRLWYRENILSLEKAKDGGYYASHSLYTLWETRVSVSLSAMTGALERFSIVSFPQHNLEWPREKCAARYPRANTLDNG